MISNEKQQKRYSSLDVRIQEFAESVVSGQTCPLCHQVLKDYHDLVCARCADRIRPVSGQRCFKCGKPVLENEEYCRDCTDILRALTDRDGAFFLR